MRYSIARHEWKSIIKSIEDQFFFFFSNEDNPILVHIFIYISYIRGVQKSNELTKTKSNPVITNTSKIQMLYFLFNLNEKTITKVYNFCFLQSISNLHRFVSQMNGYFYRTKFHYQGANGYFMRLDLISPYSPYPSRSETVYWNNQAKQIAFFGWNWSWIARLSPISR